MIPLSGPVFSSIQHKEYRYQQIRHTNVSIASTVSIYAVQFPQSIATYLKGAPDPGGGLKQAQTRTHNVNQASQTRKASKGDLALR